jgi:hypothetical protein
MPVATGKKVSEPSESDASDTSDAVFQINLNIAVGQRGVSPEKTRPPAEKKSILFPGPDLSLGGPGQGGEMGTPCRVKATFMGVGFWDNWQSGISGQNSQFQTAATGYSNRRFSTN